MDRKLTGADLAGALEGEQIADLIDFVIQVAQQEPPAAKYAKGALLDIKARANQLKAEILRRAGQ